MKMRGWRLVVAGVLVACGLGWAAAPARADDGVRLSGTTGWAGRCHRGRPILVRARIGADRLVSGVLSAEASGAPSVATEVPVEVAGGTEEEVVLVASSPFGCGEVTVKLREKRGITTTRLVANDAGDTVLLGLLPGALRGSAPPASAVARTGVAAVAAFEPDVLDRPGAVAGLDTIGATATDLDGLSADQRRALTGWVAAGGTLLVDAVGPDALGALPETWRPAAGGRTAAGRGQVRLTGSALRDGRLDGLAEPGTTSNVDGGGFGFNAGGERLSATLQRRSGVRVLSLPVILGALGLYVLLVGPGARIGLRRLGRLQLTWLVVPLVAVTFAGLAVAGGDVLRRGGQATHLSVVETELDDTRARTYVGVPTRSKGSVVANLPAGWLAGTQGSEGGLPGSTVRTTSNGQRLQAPARPGGFVVLGAEGPGSVEGRLTIMLGADGRGGEVRNNLRVPLEDVTVLGPGGFVAMGRLAPGATTTFAVPSGSEGVDAFTLAHQAWPLQDHLADADAYGSLSGSARGLGTVPSLVAAGWTDRLPSPIALRGGRPSGTTLVLGRPDGGPPIGESVGSANNGTMTTRFVVPVGAGFRLNVAPGRFAGAFPVFPDGRGVVGFAEVLVEGRWVPAKGGEPLPQGASTDGVVYVRSTVKLPVLPSLEPV